MSNKKEVELMKKRNVILAVLFTFISFGIYGIYWFVKLTNDSNTIDPEHKTAGGGMAILFSIITCGIYDFYWAHKLGKKLTGSGVLYLLLMFFGLGGIIFILAQLKINEYIDKHPAEQPAATDAQ